MTQDDEKYHAWLEHAKFRLVDIFNTSIKDDPHLRLLILEYPDPNWMLPIADDNTAIMFLVSSYTVRSLAFSEVDLPINHPRKASTKFTGHLK